MPFLYKRNTIFETHPQYQGHPTIIFKTQAIQNMHPPKMPKQGCAFLGLLGYYRKFIKDFVKIAKPLTLLTCQQMKFDWTLTHHDAFLMLKESNVWAPTLWYPDPNKWYIVYTDAPYDACGATVIPETWWYRIPYCLSFPYLFGNTKKWSTTEQEAYRVCYAITKWNYYLQGADIIVWNDHKPLNKFRNGKRQITRSIDGDWS